MRISTQSVYDRGTANMGSLSAIADRLQTQIATGKKFTGPSDDAAAWRRLTGIKRAVANETADIANVRLASALLSSSDTALDAIGTQLQRARELAVQASTGTLTDAQKQSIATSLDAIVEDVFKLANTRDLRGQPLFGGATGDVAYTRASDGTISYAGTGEPAAIPIGDGAEIHATTAGDRIFGGVSTPGGPSDAFAILQGLAAAIRTGGTASTAASSQAIDTLNTAIEQVVGVQSSVGARAARLEIESERLAEIAVDREEARSGIEDTDISASITQLQKTLTILQATQASFTKLTSLSLFSYLR
jgi:flagellar hook-associated protein 3 FlgL